MTKAFRIIKNILVWTVVAVAILMMVFTVVSVSTFDRSDRNLFGYRAYIVKTDSMSATDFSAGDLILTKYTDPTQLQVGDIITFISQDSDSFGHVITHKIRAKVIDAEGNNGFITYGTTTGTDDETIVTYPYILGKYQAKVKGMGHFFNFLKTTQGYFICIFIPFALLIGYQGYNCIKLFRKYKEEQLAEMEQERNKLAEERAENARLLEELKALKAQMTAPEAPAETPAEPPAEATAEQE